MDKIPKKYLDLLFKDVELITDPKEARDNGWLGFYIGNICILGYNDSQDKHTWYGEGPYFNGIINMFNISTNSLYDCLAEYFSKKFNIEINEII